MEETKRQSEITAENGGQSATVDEKTLQLFREKSDFLLKQTPFEFSEIYFRDFISYVFERNNMRGQEVEPFEERGSHEYTDIWLPQKDNKQIDYSGYGMWRYNPIILYRTRRRGQLVNDHYILLKDNYESIDFLENRKFAIISPITYVGRNRYAKNARYLYAFVIDLDGVGMKQIADLIYQQQTDVVRKDGTIRSAHSPMANIIVNSGHGLHLYYLLEKPVALYKENIPLLRQMKRGLVNLAWNRFTSDIDERQYQGIFQGFRVPETFTKFGEKIRAFRNADAPMHTLEELNAFLSESKLKDEEIAQLEGKSPNKPLGVTVDEAKRQWPDWYERVIVNGDKRPKKWHIKRDLYDWWLRRLRDDGENIMQGHRYFCVLALAVYAMKCDIEEEELKRDAYSLLGKMDGLTKDDDNHFTEQDIEDALMGFKIWYCTFPRNSISYLTGLPIKENRRNNRKQEVHLARIRALQNFDDPEGRWRGRPEGSLSTIDNSKVAARIGKWIKEHPDNHNKSACARDLSMSRTTVIKWWNRIELKQLGEDIQEGLNSVSPENPVFRKELSEDEYLEIMSAEYHMKTIEMKKKDK